jgi:transcriptional regulator
MYLPNVFAETDEGALLDLVERHPFGTLIAAGDAPEIAHLPFLLDRAGRRLRAHVARANPIWKVAAPGRPLVAIFAGPHAYVSPRWYERPADHVPTWNYAVVHVHGRAGGALPPEALARLIGDLSARYEPGGWGLAPELRDELLPQIVGFEIAIERLEGKFKLSQNRDPADHARVMAALAARGTPDDVEMAELMRSRPPRARR